MSILYILPALLISITFHELAHGYVAYKLGDPTAKDLGRLTLNPIKHIDPVGFLSLLILRFGWAKPVPYNPSYFKNRRQGTLLVAIAGPITNIILALLSLIAIALINTSYSIWYNILEMMFLYNIIFAVFNSLPVPPLDGSKILASILPEKLETFFWKYEKYGYIILLILIFTNVLGMILEPAISVTMNVLVAIVQFFL
ncbi:site-2 protease family protein [Alkalibaculum sp. M08DMB]|uniref:Site-2 protease family protein n=2 Tax=Alkalibaculum sporogenes TaxID=2655001 RepID=A0A6A7K7K7_9FIRM|nr:site-2 protease family protein [Alkalibaculum sporogenes]